MTQIANPQKPKIWGIKVTPGRLKLMLNMYPPYLGTGIRVDYISKDWKQLRVSMVMRWFNRNSVNTHYGGSLYSMVDPYPMLQLMQLLGKDYMVWDKSACIEFIKPSRKTVRCVINITDEDIDNIRRQTASGDKYLANFVLEVKDDDDVMIAKVLKVIYVRRK